MIHQWTKLGERNLEDSKLQEISTLKTALLAVASVTIATTTLASAASAQLTPDTASHSSHTRDIGKALIERPIKNLLFKTDSGPQAPARDFSKSRIEGPVKSLLKSGSSDSTLKSLSSSERFRISPFIKRSLPTSASAVSESTTSVPSISERASTNLATSSHTATSSDTATSKHKLAADDKVSTGLVSWRRDMKDAMKHSARSGKPLLVFHMMGMLDDRFC